MLLEKIYWVYIGILMVALWVTATGLRSSIKEISELKQTVLIKDSDNIALKKEIKTLKKHIVRLNTIIRESEKEKQTIAAKLEETIQTTADERMGHAVSIDKYEQSYIQLNKLIKKASDRIKLLEMKIRQLEAELLKNKTSYIPNSVINQINQTVP